jgi:hypothetical protein
MGFGKFLGCVIGGAAAIIAAPIVVPAAAAVATAAAGTAVGGAVIGAASTAGAAVAGVASAAASTAVGGAVIGAASTAEAAVTGIASTALGEIIGSSSAGIAGKVASGAVTSTVKFIGEKGVLTAIGAGVTYSGITAVEGFSNMSEAEEKIEKARSIYSDKSDELEKVKKATNLKLEDLNKLKMKVYSTDIYQSIEIIKNIKVPKESGVDFADKDITILFKKNEIDEIHANSIKAKDILNQTVNGMSVMKAAAGGSLGFMSTFGIASTGTAISSLSGAAATNATLAALGGGSLASGGGGMALGSTVLGGLTVVPAAMILSHQYAKKSEETLTEATEYYSRVRKEVGNIEAMVLILKEDVDKRIDEIQSTIVHIVDIYRKKVFIDLKEAYDKNKDFQGKVDYKLCSSADKAKICMAAYFLRQMKKIISVKILDSDNNISKESEDIVKSINNDSKIKEVK